jgi:parvulin-like peptidyl-prolyl isomerase
VEPASALTTTEVLTAQPTAEPLPTPTPMTEEAFQERYNTQLEDLKSINISERQYRSWIEASVLQERLREALRDEVPQEMEQVQSRYFAVDAEELANEVAERLSEGEPFETIDAELRATEDATGYGVDLGWLPRSLVERRIGDVLAALAFNREVGSVTEPLLGPQGEYYYVLEIIAREVHPLSEDVRGQLADQSFQQWLDEQRMEVEYNDYYDVVPTEP